MNLKQVEKEHYLFSRYMTKRRWASIWHQIDEVTKLQSLSILEIGPGPGAFKALCIEFGLKIQTLDIDKDMLPDYVASADDMPLNDSSFDTVCAFQVLEHVPFQQSLMIFSEMCRVARKNIVISLPDAMTYWPYSIHIPKIGEYKFILRKPFWRKTFHEYDGQHYWEINKKGYDENYVRKCLLESGSVTLKYTYRVKENPYHRFYIFDKKEI